MAQMEKLKKILESLRSFQTLNKNVPEKPMIPVKYLRQDSIVTKKDCTHYCHLVADILCSSSLRHYSDFQKLLFSSIEVFLSLCNNDDADIRNAVNEALDKVILNLSQIYFYRLQNEFLKEIKKPNSPSRSLRVAMLKFAELSHFLNPLKYHVGNLYNALIGIIKRSDDDLLQDTLLQTITTVYPLFTPYSSDKDITNILDAYLENLSSNSSTVRRSSSLSIVTLLESTRKPYHYYLLLLNKLLNLISTSRINKSENLEYLLSGVFMTVKIFSPKLAIILNENSDHIPNLNDYLTENLFYIFQQLINSIKSSTNNIVIVSALEALVVFINSMPSKLYIDFVKLNQNNCEFKNEDYIKMLPQMSKDSKVYESNLSISSSINYVENINDDLSDDLMKKGTICMLDNNKEDDCKSVDISEFNDSEATDYFDRESEFDVSLSEVRSPELDAVSSCSSGHTNRRSQMSFDYHTENIDYSLNNEVVVENYNLGEVYSLEYTAKLICLKYLLKGECNQLIDDEDVRVSIKSLALSCISNIIHICPQALCLKIERDSKCQYLCDVLLYSYHADPNLKGCVASIIGKYFAKIFLLPNSYGEFLSENNFQINALQLNCLTEKLYSIMQDPSSIAVKHALLSFQLFLPPLLKSTEFSVSEVIQMLECLIALKSHSYWLVKVELINLFASVPFLYVRYFEQRYRVDSVDSSSSSTVLFSKNQKCTSISKLIIEDLMIPMIFDDDHRVRQAANSVLGQFVQNLFLSNYTFDNDPINLAAFETLLSDFCYSHKSKVFNGSYPSLEFFNSPIDYSTKIDSVFSLNISGNIRTLVVESNLLYLVNRLLFQLSNFYEKKMSVIGSINALAALCKAFPPSQYSNGWNICSTYPLMCNKSIDTIHFLIELLTKNSLVMLDFTAHQNLICLIIALFEANVYSAVNVIQSNSDKFKLETHDNFLDLLSPNFSKCIEAFFLHLFKVMVAYSAILEENSLIFTTFIHNYYSKNLSQFATSLKKRSAMFLELKDKDSMTKRQLSNKSLKNHEFIDFDPLYYKLFDYLKNYLNSKRSKVNKTDRCSLITTVLSSFSRLFEILNATFFYSFLDNFLFYIPMIFYLNPAQVVKCVKQVLKCIFNVNYVSLFVDFFNINKNRVMKSNLCSDNNYSKVINTVTSVNSLYSSYFSIPYIQFNEFYNNYRVKSDTSEAMLTTNLSWLRNLVDFKNSKVISNQSDTKTTQEFNLEKYLSVKIHSFEPLVIQSIKHYRICNDPGFQSQVLDFLTELIQFHINYSLLDPDYVFLEFILKQFEYLENIQNCQPYECLVKRIFYFLSTLSREHYISPDLINIPKIIQLCDGLIANGHKQLAIDGLYIIIDNIFFYYSDFNDDMPDSEAQREVVLAYCFKLIDEDQTFELLRLIVNYYKCFNKSKWSNLSMEIMNNLVLKLSQNVIQLKSVESFERLQSLIYNLCSTAFIENTNFVEYFFNEFHECQNFTPSFASSLSKILVYLNLSLLSLNEETLFSNLQSLKASDESLEDRLVSRLFDVFQMIITELSANFPGDGQNEKAQLLIYLLSHYNLLITFAFHSGFYTKLTISAMNYIRSQAKKHDNNVGFCFAKTNQLFLRASKFYPNITASWLYLLYVLNYDNLLETLSNCIEPRNGINYQFSDFMHSEIVKRCSTFLLCDFLSENLENVEYLSWIIINHLKEIIDLCGEMPIKDFIIAIHRKSSSSGLFLQAVNTRCNEDLSNPKFASKILDCLERAHPNQSLSLIMFLLEKFLFNEQLATYYKCCKYAEIIISDRLSLMYNLNSTENSQSDKVFSNADINNLVSILKNTSYNKLYFTVMSIKNKFYTRPESLVKIEDPLREKHRLNTEINKIWFMDLVANHLSECQNNAADVIALLEKLPNEDIVQLVGRPQFEIYNFKHILQFIIEKVTEQEKLSKSKLFEDFNRISLLKSLFPMLVRLVQVCADCRVAIFLSEQKSIPHCELKQMFENEPHVHFIISFLGTVECLVSQCDFFTAHVNVNELLADNSLPHLLAIYAGLVHLLDPADRFIDLINLLQLIKSALSNQNLFSILADAKHFYLQSFLIDCTHHLFSQHYKCNSNVTFPPQMNSNTGEVIEKCEKMITMFHYLEEEWQLKKINAPQLLHSLLKDIILKLARFPFVNSLLYVPHNLFVTKNANVWNGVTFTGPFGTKIPIVAAHFLNEKGTIKQFSFRISHLSYSGRIQFEEIWMTLLGVFSETLSTLSQTTSDNSMSECVAFSRLVIAAITDLLCNTQPDPSPNPVAFNSYRASLKNSKFGLIEHTIEKKMYEIEDSLKQYNRPHFTYHSVYESKKFIEKASPDDPSDFDPNTSIDLYSCIQFLIDLYMQTVKSYSQRNLIFFPILTEIAKSCLYVSDLFVEKNQYMTMLELFWQLASFVEQYDDEVLNQYVIVGVAKCYSILGTTDEYFDKHKRILIEQHFKDFHLLTRINAIRGLKFLTNSSRISLKDLQPIMEYLGKHLTAEHVMPSSYCKEYVDELWRLAFFLINTYGEIAPVGEFFEKNFPGLMKTFMRNKSTKNARMMYVFLQQLLYSNKINLNKAARIKDVCFNRIHSSTSQLNTIYMLNLLICTAYSVESIDFDLETPNDNNDELFRTMEKLSTLFNPLKSCNSFEAAFICQVYGHFLTDFFPKQDILNKSISEFLSSQQNHYKYLTNIFFIIFKEFHNDFQHGIAQDWVTLSLSSFTQLLPMSHALWALTCFLICGSQNHWIRASFVYFQNKFGQFDEQDKRAFLAICNNFYNEIKSDDNKNSFIKTFQKAACLSTNTPYFEVLKYLCDI